MKLSFPIGFGVLLLAAVMGSAEGSDRPNLRHEEEKGSLRHEEPHGAFQPRKSPVDLSAIPKPIDAQGGVRRLESEMYHEKASLHRELAEVTLDTGCMGDAAIAAGLNGVKVPTNLGCTANDVDIAQSIATDAFEADGTPLPTVDCFINGVFVQNGCFECFLGDPIVVQLDTTLQTNSQERRSDIGIWYDQDAEGDAKGGTCNHVYFIADGENSLPGLDPVNDTCGDIAFAQSFEVDSGQIEVECGPSGAERVNVPYCIGWKIPGADIDCDDKTLFPYLSLNDDYDVHELSTTPGTKSKCRCGSTELNIIVRECEFSATCIAQDFTEDCDAPLAETDPDVIFNVTSCGTLILTSADAGDKCGGSITRTYTLLDDLNGNEVFDEGEGSATCVQTITIIDNPPMVTAPADDTLECPADTSTGSTGVGNATDDCDDVLTPTFSDVSVPGCGDTETITRTWSVMDSCGQSDSDDQIITVVDTTPPVITCPSDASYSCNAAIPARGTATATDTCGDATVADDGCCFDAGSLTRSWNATDDCGNVANCTQTLTISCEP